jgi:hypothetical protein
MGRIGTGSELKALHEKQEFIRAAEEFAEKLTVDPYQPGIIHPNIGGDDIQEIVDDVLFIRGFSEVTIKITKGTDELTISAEVLNRK